MSLKTSRISFRPALRYLRFAAAALVLMAPAWAQQGGAGSPPPSRIVDRTDGEDEQIRRRHEWFFSSRMAGADSPEALAGLRLEGVRQTRLAIERQRALRTAGGGRTPNVWVAKGPAPSTFGGWSFGTVSGRVSALTADWDGDVLYLGTASGGVWKSGNDGLSWTQIFDTAGTMTVGAVAVDPNDPNVLWVGTGENVSGCESYFGIGLLRSGDGGATWEARNGTGADTLQDLASFADVVIDPRDSNHIITGGRIRQCQDGSSLAGGLYRSVDGGMTWSTRLASLQVYEIKQDPSVLDVYWAATSGGVYKSSDNGLNWTLQTASGLPSGSTGRTELAIAPSDTSTVYALFSSPLSLWRTLDGGASWSQMASGSNACDGQCGYNMVLRVDPLDRDTVYRGTVHVFKSVNGGATWSDLSNNWGSSQTVHQDTHVLLMDPSTTGVFYVGSDGGLWKSSDGGSSFSNLNGNLNVTQFYAVGVRADDPEIICGGAQDNSSLVRTTTDTWDLQAVTGDGFVCQFDTVDTDYAYITSYPSGGYPNVWRSSTGVFGGWSDVTGSGSGVIANDRIGWVTPYTLDPQNPQTLYLGTHRAYRSDNRGGSWTQVGPTDLTAGSGVLRVLEVNRNYPDTVFSGSSDGRVWRSTNRGDDWTDISAGLPSRSINDIAADPANPDRAFAVVGGFNTDHVWEWTAATGWTARPGDLPNVPHNTALMLTPDDIVVGSDVGIFRSVDGGVTFQPYMAGLPQGLVVTDLKYNLLQNVLTAGTYGRGAWQVVVDAVGPILLYDAVELPFVEVDGDGDGNVEPGETWQIRVRLRNGGAETALDTQARLTTSTPGVSIVEPVASFGDIPPGGTASSPALDVVIDPGAECGAMAVFDLIDVTTSNDPVAHSDRTAAFSLEILDEKLPGPLEAVFEDDFDPAPEDGWTHESIMPGIPPCAGFPYYDEWQTVSKDAAHGVSFHCGGGPGGTVYVRRNFAWLYYGGTDSANGAGIDIPSDAIQASVTVNHWYETAQTFDGGQVVIDAIEDGQDDYATLTPIGGYPAGVLASGNCNGLEGMPAFHGSSGGWVTSTFDLLPYAGRRVYLAFVFGSDTRPTTGEGWYVDDVLVEVQAPGIPVCQVVDWPGSVPPTVRFEYDGAGTIEASWGSSCNETGLPGQAYAVHAGDLAALRAGGAYGHTAIGATCDRTSPSSFLPGAGSEYYLVLPVEGGHQGGAGVDSNGTSRPVLDETCGLPREATCH